MPDEDTAPGPPKIVQPPPGASTGNSKGGRPTSAAQQTKAKASANKIEQGLNQWMGGLGLAATAMGHDDVGVIFASRGPEVAKAWAELARVNPNVRKTLEKMMAGSAWSGVIISTASLAMPIMQVKGVLPSNVPPLFGLTTDEARQIMALRAQRNGEAVPE